MKWLWMPIVLSLMSCASLRTSKVEINSTPAGAVVSSPDGKVLGKTPLTLTPEMLDEHAEAGRLFLVVRSPGYADREMIFDVHAEDSLLVKLNPLDDKYFSERLISDYSTKSNAMARELLRIHGLVITRNFEQAKQALVEFQTSYPTIAASYVMSADVYLAMGQLDKAQDYLLRARSLDDRDPVILHMMEKVRARMK